MTVSRGQHNFVLQNSDETIFVFCLLFITGRISTENEIWNFQFHVVVPFTNRDVKFSSRKDYDLAY